LYLGYSYRVHDTTVTLDQIEFYPSFTLATVIVNNESDIPLLVEPTNSTLSQELPLSGLAALTPLSTSGGTTLTAHSSHEFVLAFGALNGQIPFALSFGALSRESQAAWNAPIEVDPSSLIE
jgi:hypothetical protein